MNDIIKMQLLIKNSGHDTGGYGGNESTTLSITGDTPENNIVFNLPRFTNNIKSATAGVVNDSLGTVTLSPSTRKVTVYFKTMDQGRALERSKEDAPSSGNAK